MPTFNKPDHMELFRSQVEVATKQGHLQIQFGNPFDFNKGPNSLEYATYNITPATHQQIALNVLSGKESITSALQNLERIAGKQNPAECVLLQFLLDTKTYIQEKNAGIAQKLTKSKLSTEEYVRSPIVSAEAIRSRL